MTRTLAAAAALVTLVFAGAASAQTYGQPIYLNAYGRPVGGTPLSEVEMRSYVETGRWADGYSERPRIYVPLPGYGQGHPGYGYGRGDDQRPGRQHFARGYSRYGDDRSDRSSQSGYRDRWGYNDDRPPSARWRDDDGSSRRHDHDCGCADVYLYDR